MPKYRIHILFEHSADLVPHGCAYIRDILPLNHPSNHNLFEVTQGTEYTPADMIVIERTWKPGFDMESAEELVDRTRRDGSRLIYSIDDNLLDLQSIPTDMHMVIRYLCRQADGILVSTAFLIKRLEHLNSKVFLVPNAVDEQIFTEQGARWTPRGLDHERKVIGYMGTFTHDDDLMMVLQALRATLRKHHPKVELQFVGGFSDAGFVNYFQGLPVRVLKVPSQDVEYPRFIAWMKRHLNWHLGIAPLEDTYFNLSKSDIKFLDYSALGIPGIYSNVPSYDDTVRHLDTGYLAENTPDSWVEAFERMLTDDLLREKLASNAQEYVFSKRTLGQCARNWQEAIRAIVNRT